MRLSFALAACGAVAACTPSSPSSVPVAPPPVAPLPVHDAGAPSPTTPTAEQCNGSDDDADRQVDEGCPCTVGQVQQCWPGDPDKRGNLPCIDGSQQCVASGEFGTWGPCLGAIEPSSLDQCNGGAPAPTCVPSEFGDACLDNLDGDCDGLVDCADPDCASALHCSPPPTEYGCVCRPGMTRFCHVPGPCTWGMATCNPDGTWGACTDADPSLIPEACKGGADAIFGDWFGSSDYDAACCVAQGYCCDNQEYDYTLYDPTLPTHASVGNCAAVCMP